MPPAPAARPCHQDHPSLGGGGGHRHQTCTRLPGSAAHRCTSARSGARIRTAVTQLAGRAGSQQGGRHLVVGACAGPVVAEQQLDAVGEPSGCHTLICLGQLLLADRQPRPAAPRGLCARTAALGPWMLVALRAVMPEPWHDSSRCHEGMSKDPLRAVCCPACWESAGRPPFSALDELA